MLLTEEGDPSADMIEQYDSVMFQSELSTDKMLSLHDFDQEFRETLSRCTLSLPMAKGGAGVPMVYYSRPHAFLAGMMDVLNSKLGIMTHFGHLLRSSGAKGNAMGPDVFNELARVIGKLRTHCGAIADKADDPLPLSIFDMLRNHSDDRFIGRPGQAYQQRIGRLVQAVAHARVHRITHTTSTSAAAQLGLRGLPGAQAWMAATGIDSATSLTDDEVAHALRDIANINPLGTEPSTDGTLPPCDDCKDGSVITERHCVLCKARGDVTRTHSQYMRLIAEACSQCGLGFDYLHGMEPRVGETAGGNAKYADLEIRVRDTILLGDVRQVAIKMNDPNAAQAAVTSPESVLLLGDRDKLDEYKNVDQQTTGVITPFTINTETGALGKDLQKLFFVLRQRTAEEGTEFGRIVGGDLRMAEFGSWLQPTKADYYLQSLSVLHRRRKTAKVNGVVQRARSALIGGSAGSNDDTDRCLEARVTIAGQGLRHIAE